MVAESVPYFLEYYEERIMPLDGKPRIPTPSATSQRFEPTRSSFPRGRLRISKCSGRRRRGRRSGLPLGGSVCAGHEHGRPRNGHAAARDCFRPPRPQGVGDRASAERQPDAGGSPRGGGCGPRRIGFPCHRFVQYWGHSAVAAIPARTPPGHPAEPRSPSQSGCHNRAPGSRFFDASGVERTRAAR